MATQARISKAPNPLMVRMLLVRFKHSFWKLGTDPDFDAPNQLGRKSRNSLDVNIFRSLFIPLGLLPQHHAPMQCDDAFTHAITLRRQSVFAGEAASNLDSVSICHHLSHASNTNVAPPPIWASDNAALAPISRYFAYHTAAAAAAVAAQFDQKRFAVL